MTDLLDAAALARIAAARCPDCGHDGLVAGPRGGGSRNEACPVCGAEFNVVRFDGPIAMATRNSPQGKPDRERLRAVFRIELP